MACECRPRSFGSSHQLVWGGCAAPRAGGPLHEASSCVASGPPPPPAQRQRRRPSIARIKDATRHSWRQVEAARAPPLCVASGAHNFNRPRRLSTAGARPFPLGPLLPHARQVGAREHPPPPTPPTRPRLGGSHPPFLAASCTRCRGQPATTTTTTTTVRDAPPPAAPLPTPPPLPTQVPSGVARVPVPLLHPADVSRERGWARGGGGVRALPPVPFEPSWAGRWHPRCRAPWAPRPPHSVNV